MTQDKIIKALAFDQTIRIYGVLATHTVLEIKKRTGASPEVTVALGRLAMGSLLIGALDSTVAKIYTKVNGSGPVGNMNADSDAHGNVRAYATHPTAHAATQDIDDFDIPSVVGNHGFLYVIKDLGLKKYFTSQTQLVSGDLSMDFAQYFAESQQTSTAISVDVEMCREDVAVAGGFVVQALPGVSTETIVELQENMKKIPSLTKFLVKHSLADLVEVLASGSGESLEELPVQFHCNCSKERFLGVIATLPPAEIQAMVADDHDEEVICQYCGEKYYITNEELREILMEEE